MLLSRMQSRLRKSLSGRALSAQLARVNRYLAAVEARADSSPVLFFNASTRIHALSLNAAFGLLAGWSVRLSGVPTVQLVCQSGMQQCMLGTNPDDESTRPPCSACVKFSRRLFSDSPIRWIEYQDARVPELERYTLEQLRDWQFQGMPIGKICLPTLQWALRRLNLVSDSTTLSIYRQYLRSAASLKLEFDMLLDQLQPRAVVVFNGITYPEAVLRNLAKARDLPVVTHEVGLRPSTAFFSHGEATAYPIEVPDDFQLSDGMQRQLEHYLKARFEGRFTMAGVRFWPKVQPLPERLLARMREFQQTVVAFTNVVFDTSQIHANSIYADMFDWLDDLRRTAATNSRTLFVVRAHPDENRPGKQSRESVADWMSASGMLAMPNVEFLSPDDLASSYELVQKAKFILVYNSSVGLEASVIGSPVLCAGRARYTHLPTVYLPDTKEQYRQMLATFLSGDRVVPPEEFERNARRFLYYQLFHASLDFSEFLEPLEDMPGFVSLSRFDPPQLASSPALRAVQRGILNGVPFVQ